MKPRSFGAVLFAELLLLQIARLPYSLNFEYYAFGDSGGNLSLAALLSRGYRPVVDFFIPYGLGSVLWTQMWFALFPLTPWGLHIAVIASQWIFAWTLLRIGGALNLGLAGQALFMAALPAMTAPSPNAPHMLEPVFLGGALLFHLRRDYGKALSMVVLASAFRQALAYFYGLILLFWALAGVLRGKSSLKRELFPPLLVFSASAAVQIFFFGFLPFWDSLLPLTGSKMYKALGLDFLSGLFLFVSPPGRNFRYYLGTPAGAWILASLLLAAGAGIILRRRGPQSSKEELALTALFLHSSFILTMFGHPWFVGYYFFLLIIGVACLEGLPPPSRTGVPLLCVLLACGTKSAAVETLRLWRDGVRTGQTARLWAEPEMAREWGQVLARLKDRKPAMVMVFGGAELLFSQFEPTENFTLHGMSAGKRDLTLKMEQLERANAYVLYKAHERDIRMTFPAVLDFLGAKTRAEFDGRFFKVYFRN